MSVAANWLATRTGTAATLGAAAAGLAAAAAGGSAGATVVLGFGAFAGAQAPEARTHSRSTSTRERQARCISISAVIAQRWPDASYLMDSLSMPDPATRRHRLPVARSLDSGDSRLDPVLD